MPVNAGLQILPHQLLGVPGMRPLNQWSCAGALFTYLSMYFSMSYTWRLMRFALLCCLGLHITPSPTPSSATWLLHQHPCSLLCLVLFPCVSCCIPSQTTPADEVQCARLDFM